MQQAIIGFHLDEENDWVADLACGHGQHVRHNPPWQKRGKRRHCTYKSAKQYCKQYISFFSHYITP